VTGGKTREEMGCMVLASFRVTPGKSAGVGSIEDIASRLSMCRTDTSNRAGFEWVKMIRLSGSAADIFPEKRT